MITHGAGILDDFSIEMTGKDIDALNEAHAYLPASTRVNVTFLGNEQPGMRLDASRAVRRHGLTPVPHIAARRVSSRMQLEDFLLALREAGTSDHIFVVAGDLPEASGPYDSALSLIEDGHLSAFGVKSVSIGGYPEGHPDIPSEVLWRALIDKSAALANQRMVGDIITQFSFDAEAVLTWIEEVRGRGISMPIRIGVPGPAGVKRLLSYARRFGVGSSIGIVRKYGLSLTNLLSTATPDQFIHALASRLDPARHGNVKLHFYAFGGLRTTAEWLREYAVDAAAGHELGKQYRNHQQSGGLSPN